MDLKDQLKKHHSKVKNALEIARKEDTTLDYSLMQGGNLVEATLTTVSGDVAIKFPVFIEKEM